VGGKVRGLVALHVGNDIFLPAGDLSDEEVEKLLDAFVDLPATWPPATRTSRSSFLKMGAWWPTGTLGGRGGGGGLQESEGMSGRS